MNLTMNSRTHAPPAVKCQHCCVTHHAMLVWYYVCTAAARWNKGPRHVWVSPICPFLRLSPHSDVDIGDEGCLA